MIDNGNIKPKLEPCMCIKLLMNVKPLLQYMLTNFLFIEMKQPKVFKDVSPVSSKLKTRIKSSLRINDTSNEEGGAVT